MHKYCNDIAENSALIQNLGMEEVFESIKFPVRRIKIKTSAVLDTPVSYGFLNPVIIRNLYSVFYCMSVFTSNICTICGKLYL